MLHIFQNYAVIITIVARLLFKKTQGSHPKCTKQSSGEKQIHIFETYKNTVIPYGRQIYAKLYDMTKETMCPYSHSDNALTHRKCRCGAKCPSVNLPDQETDH